MPCMYLLIVPGNTRLATCKTAFIILITTLGMWLFLFCSQLMNCNFYRKAISLSVHALAFYMVTFHPLSVPRA